MGPELTHRAAGGHAREAAASPARRSTAFVRKPIRAASIGRKPLARTASAVTGVPGVHQRPSSIDQPAHRRRRRSMFGRRRLDDAQSAGKSHGGAATVSRSSISAAGSRTTAVAGSAPVVQQQLTGRYRRHRICVKASAREEATAAQPSTTSSSAPRGTAGELRARSLWRPPPIRRILCYPDQTTVSPGSRVGGRNEPNRPKLTTS